jgi:hypothetical protein
MHIVYSIVVCVNQLLNLGVGVVEVKVHVNLPSIKECSGNPLDGLKRKKVHVCQLTRAIKLPVN